jgi:hypothetical protein
MPAVAWIALRGNAGSTRVSIAEADLVPAPAAAESQPACRRRFGARAQRHSPIADAVVRILPPADAELAGDAFDRPRAEGLLELHARLPLTAPCQRHRHAAALAEQIDEAGAHAVGEAVAVFGVHDRQEHAAAPETPHRAGHLALRDVERVDAREFVDDHHQQHVVGVVDRSQALADLDAVEASAAFEPDPDLGDQLIGGRLADDVADDAEDVGIGRGVVAVHADFADHAG